MSGEDSEDVCYIDNGRQDEESDNDLEDIGNSSTEIIYINNTY